MSDKTKDLLVGAALLLAAALVVWGPLMWLMER